MTLTNHSQRDGEMVQVFDPTDGNMTPCTESLRYSNYAIKNCGFKNGGRCRLDIKLLFFI